MRRYNCFTLLLLLMILMGGRLLAQPAYNLEIKQAATLLFSSFNPMQKISGALSFSDTARLQWNNLPVGLRARVGVSIGNMTVEQRKMVHRVLSVALSSQGYLKATSVMHLDDLLNRLYDSLYYKKDIEEKTYTMIHSLLWSHKNFYFAFFGQPADAN